MDCNAITVVFDKNIVDNIINNLFYCVDDELDALSLEGEFKAFHVFDRDYVGGHGVEN